MKIIFFNFISNKIASFYWAYLKAAIDNYVLNNQKSSFLFFGTNVIFKGRGTIFHPENISIADNVQIGENYFFMGIGGISIDEGSILSRNICLHSGNHDFKSNDFLPYNNQYEKKPIKIGKGVWIGQNVNILPGISIGDGAIVGMGTTVSKNINEGEIVVGQSQRIVGYRSQNNIADMIKNDNYFATNF